METRDEIINKMINQIKRTFDSTDSIRYEFVIWDRNRQILEKISGDSRCKEIEDVWCNFERSFKAALEDHPNATWVTGVARKLSSKKDIGNYSFFISTEEGDEDLEAPTPLSPIDTLNQQRTSQVQQQPTQQKEETEPKKSSSDMVMDTLNMLSAMYGGSNAALGDIHTPEGKITSFALQFQENRHREEMEKEKHLGKIASQETEIKNLNAKISELESRLKQLEHDNDRMKDKIERDKPYLKEYQKLKTKSGMIADTAGSALGTMLAGFLSQTKYAGVLGFLDKDNQEEEQQEAPEQSIEQIQEVKEEDVKPIIEEENEEI